VSADPALLEPGFRHAVLDAQATFRAALRALSRPGLPVALDVALSPPQPLHPATAALALTLLDADTPVWLDAASAGDAARAFLRFHCGCPLVDEPGAAAFALIGDGDAMPPFDAFDRGDDLYPDQSCTLIVQLPALTGGPCAALRGPGVDGEVQLAPRGLPADFAARWALNHAAFPRGVDLLLTSGTALMGLPRSAEWRG